MLSNALIVCHGRSHRAVIPRLETDISIDYKTATFLDPDPKSGSDIRLRYEHYATDRKYPIIALIGATSILYQDLPLQSLHLKREFFKRTAKLLESNGVLYLRPCIHPITNEILEHFIPEIVGMGWVYLGDVTVSFSDGTDELLYAFTR